MARIVLAACALVAALAAAGCGGGGGNVPSGAVAVVDGEKIERSSYDTVVSQAKQSYKAQKRTFPAAGSAEFQQLKTRIVEFLVQRVQFEQEAADLGIKVTDKQVSDRLAQIKKQYFGGSDEKYRKQIKAQGLTDQEVRDGERSKLINEALYKKVTADVKVTDADVKAYYEKNKAQFGTPESRVVRHILVKTKAQADKIYDQLKAGGDFAALAKKFSQDPGSKDQGGKLTITRGQTVAPFDQTAFLLPTKSISRPVKTEYGYHIIQPLAAVKPAKTQPLDAKLKQQIRSQLLSTKKSDAMTKWVEGLKKDYADKIDYASGFAPAASSTGTTTTTG